MNEDKASRYHRLKRRSSFASLGWILLLLSGLLVTGLTVSLRNVAEEAVAAVGLSSWRAPASVFAYVALLSFLHELGGFPLGFYGGYHLDRRYDLSIQAPRSWLADQAKSFLISLILAGGAVSVIYGFIRWSPDHWWLPAGGTFALLIVGLTNLAPVVFLPLFYSVKPMNHDALRARLLALAGRAGARVLGVYEWGLAAKTRKANAALAGLGSTRRILVSDTMLADYSDDEIEVVLAHELAHHVHGDIWKGVVFEGALVVAGFYFASRALLALAAPCGLRGVSDVAGLPLLLLAAGTVS